MTGVVEESMNTELAIKLVKAGMRNCIIRTEVGLTRKRISLLRKNLNVLSASDTGPMPEAANLLQNQKKALEATIFLLSYLAVSKDPRPQAGTDLLAVIGAHRAYETAHAALRGTRVDTDVLLDIDDCYVIARDWRSREIELRECKHCKVDFVASTRNRRQACPLCSGVQINAPHEEQCEVGAADAVPAGVMRTPSELIALIPQVRQQHAWGLAQAEIASRLELSMLELAVVLAIDSLPRAVQAEIAVSNVSAAELITNWLKDHEVVIKLATESVMAA